jgi:hypothetical protein
MRLHKLIVNNFVLKTDAISEAAEMNEAQVIHTTLTEESDKLCRDLPQRCIEFARGQPITDEGISCAERWSMEMFQKGVEYAQIKVRTNDISPRRIRLTYFLTRVLKIAKQE